MDSEYQCEEDEAKQVEQELKEISKTWSPTQWEDYLRALDRYRVEGLGSAHEIESRALATNIFEYASRPCPENISKIVHAAISALTERQRVVIEKIFFEGLSERQVSRIMQISRSGVVDLKKRALRQLKIRLHKALSESPLIGTKEHSSKNPRSGRESLEKGELSC